MRGFIRLLTDRLNLVVLISGGRRFHSQMPVVNFEHHLCVAEMSVLAVHRPFDFVLLLL